MKASKSGFVIKLSSETVQKLTEEEQQTKASAVEVEAAATKPADTPVTTKEGAAHDKVPKPEKENPPKEAEPHTESKNDDTEANSEAKSESAPTTEDANQSWGEYAQHVTYEGDQAIYTDPSNQQKYTWDDSTNAWTPRNKPEDPKREYSYEGDKHIYTEPDGSKFFWDIEKKAWLPLVDDDFLALYQMSYGFVDNTLPESKKEEEAKKKLEEQQKKLEAGQKRKQDPQWFEQSDEKNTKVYVSNLPLDTTEEEFVDLMQKCGLVMRDPSTQKMKVKLYMDKEQNCFKGDALCTYIKIESVDLALKLIDGSEYKGNKIRVERAQFQLKGDYNPALKPKKKKKKELEKLKKMQEKLFDWRPEKMIGEKAKHERVVIIKNLFHPSDFDKEVQLILDYQQDLREEFAKCGEVRKVVIYDRHPEGVAQVTMKEPEEADAAVALINGRWFGKRQITAEIWDGRTKYRIAETDADLSKRIEKWDKFLEAEDKDGKEAGTSKEKLEVENKEEKEASSSKGKSEDDVKDGEENGTSKLKPQETVTMDTGQETDSEAMEPETSSVES